MKNTRSGGGNAAMQIFLDEAIKQFVTTDSNRIEAMGAPISDKGTVIATNAHIMVIAPDNYFERDYDTMITNSKFPNYDRVVPEHDKTQVICTIPTDDLLYALNALPVEDKYVDCEECEGDGSLYTKASHSSRECSECGGTGHDEYLGRMINIPADEDKANDESYLASVDGVRFNPNLLLKMAKLATYMQKDVSVVTSNKNLGNVFYIGDVMVLVMPVRWYENEMKEHCGKLHIIDVKTKY